MNKQSNCAETIDLMNIRIALGFLVVSLAYAMEASVYLVPEGFQKSADVFSLVLGGISMVLILWAIGPSLLRKIRTRSFSYQQPESFIVQAFNQALSKSWVITMVSLVVLKTMDKLVASSNLPIDFYFKAMTFLMMFSASVVFLVLIRSDDEVELS